MKITVVGTDMDNSWGLFEHLLHEFELEYNLIKSASNESILNALLKNPPNIIFIDIDNVVHFQYLSFEINKYLQSTPKVIAISSNINEAYQCIKCDFSDFLLKPFSSLELRKAFSKIIKETDSNASELLCVKTYSDYHFLNYKDIVYLKADNNATDIYSNSGKKLSIIKSLKHFETALPNGFQRIHNSYIINIQYIERINFGKSHLYLNDQDSIKIPFSKSYRQKVESLKGMLASEDIYF